MMKTGLAFAALIACGACTNPGGIPDEGYAMYRELERPKLIWTCTLRNRDTPEAETRFSECLMVRDDSAQMACMEELESWKEYSTTEPGVSAGFEGATYDVLVEHARAGCNGEFRIVASER